ncbi:hypothetical protein AXI58_10090 [Bacillus nakamurai]|uniref:Uncharacterized protein n=2 Tax=Bacillus TaxID=1386 RepID=A0A150FAQ8_9BACI|nr:hypothetical protein AXI58_10090 [Bacillus nakamurai]
MRKTYMTTHVIEFLESIVQNDWATQSECELYEDFKLFGTIDKESITYKRLVYKYLRSDY